MVVRVTETRISRVILRTRLSVTPVATEDRVATRTGSSGTGITATLTIMMMTPMITVTWVVRRLINKLTPEALFESGTDVLYRFFVLCLETIVTEIFHN